MKTSENKKIIFTTNTTSGLPACGNETSMQLEKDITKVG
jgi:hypothetical protein